MKKPYKELLLNVPQCDWITLTSWLVDAFDGLIQDPESALVVHRLNYDGLQEGKLFVGEGTQRGFMHKILQVSGKDAHMALISFLHLPEVTCTHLDLQVTCEWQSATLSVLAGRLLERGYLADFRTSNMGDTCYIYSRKSDRFIRVYHKSKHEVRFEVSYKKPFAMPMFRLVAGLTCNEGVPQIEEQLGIWLRYELDRVNDHELNQAFAGALAMDGSKPPKFVPAPENDTERWLRKIVAPALSKYVHSHDNDPYLVNHLIQILGGFDNDKS